MLNGATRENKRYSNRAVLEDENTNAQYIVLFEEYIQPRLVPSAGESIVYFVVYNLARSKRVSICSGARDPRT